MSTYPEKETIRLSMDSDSRNERMARVVVAAFMARLDPTMEEMEDVKTAVSEAVTNAILHGYREQPGEILMELTIQGPWLRVLVEDHGVGIPDIEKAKEPFYTTQDRSGMGFCFMESFMDQLVVESEPWKGTRVIMEKQIGAGREQDG